MKLSRFDESDWFLGLLNEAHHDYRRDREEYGWDKPPLDHAAEVLESYPQLAKLAEGSVTRERLLEWIIDPSDPRSVL